MNRYEGSPAVVIERRKGTPDSPFSDMNESLVVASDGKVVLTEIPNELNRVIVTSDDNTTWYEIKNGKVPLNGFKVDYINKLVTFNIANVGKQLHFKYFGEGNHYYSLHSIYTKLEDGSVVETLGDLIENGTDALDALGKLDQKLDEVNQATNNANTAASDTRVVIEEGNQVIGTATIKITEIDNKIDEVTTKITDLDLELEEARSTIVDVQQKATVVETIITDGQDVINNAESVINEVKSVGNFNLETFYKKNNTVIYEGSSWIALKDTQNNPLPVLPATENTYWRLSALHGSKGDKGDTGAALSIQGKLTDASQLPPSGQAGHAYSVNGELYVWSENTDSWENVGNIKGEKGDTGNTGEDGLSAYQVAVNNGFVGTSEEWLASLKGDKGQDADLTEVNQNISNLQLSSTKNQTDNLQRGINVKFPPSPLTAAVGNGIVNDQPAIQAIINYVSTNGGGTVFLPKGIYNVESSIMMKKGVSLKGVNGRFSTRLKWAKSTSGYIIDIRNIDLALCSIEDISFETANTTRVGSGIIGGSSFENYNATSIRFKNLLFFGLDVGIHGKGVSESSDSRAIGIFDSYFENIWCSDCNAGMWLGGSGNLLINPRLSGCNTGIVMDYASPESSTGIQVFGGVFASNSNYDLSISDQRGIRNSIFVGSWFEDATSGIINIPNASTTVRTLSFVNCQLHSKATQYGLMNFYNAKGLIKVDSCTITQTLQNQDTNLIPPTDSAKGKLVVRDCVKYDYTGVQTFL